MNLPNKLTIFRACMIPFFVFFMETSFFGDVSKFIAVTIFIVASVTDAMDGHIARKYNLVTNFGKFMDPLADKLLVCAALICLAGVIPKWIVIVIISRELIISGFRTIAADNGVVIAASYWGKFKTIFQMIMIIWLILDFDFKLYQLGGQLLIYISLALTVISMLDYVIKNRKVLSDNTNK